MSLSVHGLLLWRQKRRWRDDEWVVRVRKRDDGGIGREELVMERVRWVEDGFGLQGYVLEKSQISAIFGKVSSPCESSTAECSVLRLVRTRMISLEECNR